VVDRMRDEAFIMLVRKMNESPEVTQQALDALLVARNLERSPIMPPILLRTYFLGPRS